MNTIKAAIFDLDGVIVSTDEFHYIAWKRLADEEHIPFDRRTNDRLRGVSRMESLEIILSFAQRNYSSAEKEVLATRKNTYYRDSLTALSPSDILPGVRKLCDDLRARGIKLGIGSSSKNSPAILRQIGLGSYFDATADGNDIKRSKPDPEVFLLAAKRLGVSPVEAVVFEDAESGVTAALTGGFRCVALGAAAADRRAHLCVPDLSALTSDRVLTLAKLKQRSAIRRHN